MSFPFRYKKLGYLALNVTDIERTHAFAVDVVGLDAAGSGDAGERYYRVGSTTQDRYSVVLYPAQQAGFKRAGWQVETAEDLDRAYEHFKSLNFSPAWIEDPAERGPGRELSRVFRVREPATGCLFEYYDRMQQVSMPYSARLAKIERLGHFGIGHPDVLGAARRFEADMGFLVSDYVDRYAALMRVFPSPLHHSMGLAMAPQPQFNHMNFMVTDIDDIGRALWRLRKHDVPIVFGPGRHPTSDSIFIYFLDPDGMTWEYSFGMELFPESGAREARIMSAAPQDFDLWGALPEAQFGKAGNIELD